MITPQSYIEQGLSPINIDWNEVAPGDLAAMIALVADFHTAENGDEWDDVYDFASAMERMATQRGARIECPTCGNWYAEARGDECPFIHEDDDDEDEDE